MEGLWVGYGPSQLRKALRALPTMDCCLVGGSTKDTSS